MVLDIVRKVLGPDGHICRRCDREFVKTQSAIARDHVVHFIPLEHPLCDDCIAKVSAERARKIACTLRRHEERKKADARKRIRRILSSL